MIRRVTATGAGLSRTFGRVPPWHAAIGCVLFAAACESGTTGDVATVVDSAGVRVVTNGSSDVPSWTLTTEPLLSVGSVEGGGPDELDGIGSVRRLPSGSVAVFNGGTGEVRVFGSDGVHLRSFGGQGDGPGEFRGGGRIRTLPGDTIAVWDTRLRRVTVFDPTGEVVRTQRPDGVGPRSEFAGYYDGGRMLVVIRDIAPMATEFAQRFASYLLYGESGALIDSLPRQPGTFTGPLGIALFGPGSGPAQGGRLFGEATVTVGDRSGFWVATQKSEEIVRYALDGRLTTIVRWPAEDRVVGPDDADLELERMIARGGNPEAITRLHNAMPVSELFPAYDEVLVGIDESAWVKEFERPGHAGPVLWRVFGTDGVLTATVEIPSGLDVHEVGSDFVLGVVRDELDVQYVHMYGIERAGG